MGANVRLFARLAMAMAGLALSAAATAQSAASAYTTGYRYDANRRVVGTISPPANPASPTTGPYLAVRNTYNTAGELTKVETGELSSWQDQTVAPANWAGFTLHTITEFTYDDQGRKLTEKVKGSDLVAASLTQYSYDPLGRIECTAVRMNPAVYGSLPGACTLGVQGSQGPDRVTKNHYDAAGRLDQVREAVGTSGEGSQVTYSYTANGLKQDIVDANGNKAELRYDGFDRQVRWVFPSKTRPASFDDSTAASALASAGALNEADYEAYSYDAAGNRLSLRKRDGSTLTYTYDFLNRMTVKTVPSRTGLAATHTRDVYYAYDLQSHQTKARFDSLAGEGDTTTYDGFGRITSASETMDGQTRALSFLYDKNGNRTKITHPDAAYFAYAYDGLDRLDAIRNSAAQTLVALAYNTRGLLASAARYGSAQDQAFGYDPAGRLASLGISGGGTPSLAVAWDFTRNAAGQLLTDHRDNDQYAFPTPPSVDYTYTTNGLNQYTAVNANGYCYDANGNLTADGDHVYLYDVENRLVEMRVQGSDNGNCASLLYTGTLLASLRYDPAGRLHEVKGYNTSGTMTSFDRFLYDGDALVGEYNSAGALQRRYVHGSDAGADDPLVWFEGTTSTGYTSARHLYADPRGSIVLVGNYAGSAVAIDSYDEWGAPDTPTATITAKGRFRYTGQAWLPEIGMYYYKARMYSPALGRFMQTDPIGYDGGVNIYAYVGDDPIDQVDFKGEEAANITNDSLKKIREDAKEHPADPTAVKVMVIGTVAAIGGIIIEAPVLLTDAVAGAEEVASASEAEGVASQAAKLSKVEKSTSSREIGAKFTEKTEVRPGKGPGQSRAEYKRVKNPEGRTIRTYKDSYDRAGKFQGRKALRGGPEGRPQNEYPVKDE